MGVVWMTVSTAPNLHRALPRRRTLVRSWLLLVLALLGALLALLFGGLRGAQLASSIPIPNTATAAQGEAMMHG